MENMMKIQFDPWLRIYDTCKAIHVEAFIVDTVWSESLLLRASFRSRAELQKHEISESINIFQTSYRHIRSWVDNYSEASEKIGAIVQTFGLLRDFNYYTVLGPHHHPDPRCRFFFHLTEHHFFSKIGRKFLKWFYSTSGYRSAIKLRPVRKNQAFGRSWFRNSQDSYYSRQLQKYSYYRRQASCLSNFDFSKFCPIRWQS